MEALRVLEEFHGRSYLEWLRRLCRLSPRYLDDGDTYVTPSSFHTVLASTATLLEALKMLRNGFRVVVAATRPPSHHAYREPRGFCLAGCLAAALSSVLDYWGRIAILDIDAHYGDGLAEAFYGDPRVLYISLHQDPRTIFPYRGFPEEFGRGEGRGYTINIPLPVGASDDEYEAALTTIVEPVIEEYDPDLLVVAYGSDAHWRDEISDLKATTTTYYRVSVAVRRARRILVVLEGGYEEWSLTRCLKVLLEGLVGRDPSVLEEPVRSPRDVSARMKRFIERVLRVHREYWCSLRGV